MGTHYAGLTSFREWCPCLCEIYAQLICNIRYIHYTDCETRLSIRNVLSWSLYSFISSLSVQNLVCDQIWNNHFFPEIDRWHDNTYSDKTWIFVPSGSRIFWAVSKPRMSWLLKPVRAKARNYLVCVLLCRCKTSYNVAYCFCHYSFCTVILIIIVLSLFHDNLNTRFCEIKYIKVYAIL